MAHESHAADTLFIIGEPDFRFTKEHATATAHWWEEQERLASQHASWDEVADSSPETDRAAFGRDVAKWEAAARLDQNARWPIDAEADPQSETLDTTKWVGELIRWGERTSIAYTRPRKPPVGPSSPTGSASTCTTCMGCSPRLPASAAGASAGWAGAQRNGRKGMPKPANRVRPADLT